MDHCKSCSDTETCEICQKTFLMKDGACKCALGFKPSTIVNQCVSCKNYLCRKCSKPQVCVECEPDFILKDGKCGC